MTHKEAVARVLADSPYLRTHYLGGDTGVPSFIAGAAAAELRIAGETYDPTTIASELRRIAKSILDEQ